MNIRTEQVEALLRQQELTAKKPVSSGEGFGAALAQQVNLAGTEKSASATVPPPGVQSGIVGQMLLAETEKTAADPVEAVMQQAMNQASGALDMWDSYINALGKPGADNNLRDAYALLQGLDTEVTSLKQNAQPVLGQNPNLAGIINELEVLTTTEKFKFNRGDYS